MIKKLLFLFITLTTFSNVSYASFPVAEHTQTELVCENTETPTYGNKQSIWGILSIAFALISLLLYVSAFMIGNLGMLSTAWGLGFFALIFGVIGLFGSKPKGLALTGLILGVLESITLLFFIISFANAFGN